MRVCFRLLDFSVFAIYCLEAQFYALNLLKKIPQNLVMRPVFISLYTEYHLNSFFFHRIKRWNRNKEILTTTKTKRTSVLTCFVDCRLGWEWILSLVHMQKWLHCQSEMTEMDLDATLTVFVWRPGRSRAAALLGADQQFGRWGRCFTLITSLSYLKWHFKSQASTESWSFTDVLPAVAILCLQWFARWLDLLTSVHLFRTSSWL